MVSRTSIVCILLLIIQTINGQFNCLTPINNCTCATNQISEYDINCPDMFKPYVSVRVSADNTHIICDNVTYYNFMPEVNIGEKANVRIENCYLPDGFEDIMHRLSLRNVKSLKFDMCGDPLQCFHDKLVVTSRYMRGMESLIELRLQRNFITEIESDALKNMPKLEEIDFYSNNITSISNIFDYTPNVKRIDLANNQLVELPANVFKKISKLRILHLWGNKLRKIDEKLFSNVTNITVLELSSNELTELPSNLLQPLVNLKQVNFLGNQLSLLPEELFRNNRLLQNLRLARNKISTLPQNIFAGLNQLEELDLSSNLLQTVPDDLFKDLHNLKTLNMQHNLLTLPTNWFSNLNNLLLLDLSRNKITRLHERLFDGLGNLKKLRLGFNKLSAITKQLPLGNLEELELQNNSISDLDFSAFYILRNLKTLNLSINKLSVLKRIDGSTAFNYLLSLEDLNLRNNSLTDFYEDFILSARIRRVDLSCNNISSISLIDLKTTSEKATISLKYNQIKTVYFGYLEEAARTLLQDESETTVLLSGNPIDCNCSSYQLSKYFHKLIDSNILHRFTLEGDDLKCGSPARFLGRDFNSINPKELVCDVLQNCPTNCSCKMRPSDESFIVDCANRNLYYPPVLRLDSTVMPRTIVKLEGNSLTEFPGVGSGYDNVTDLHLQNNELTQITWIPPKIEILSLQENNLTSLGYRVLTMLNVSKSLKTLYLNNNPWSCDCSASTLNFTEVLKENLIRKITAENLTCADRNLNLLRVTADDLCESNTTLIIALGACLFTILITLAFAMALYYKYNQEIKIWLYSHNLLLWFVTEEDLDRNKIYDAFLSYSHKDEDFVVNHLLPELEGGSNPYKLCIHERDWLVGEFITTQIMQSVQNSRRTIVVLSPNFPHSVWAKMEFRTAHTEAMSERRARVIVIMYGDVKIDEHLDEELRSYLKTNTYLKWGDPWFWKKLRYALPHIHNTNKNNKMNNMLRSIDEKADLINSPSTPNVGTPPAVSLDPLLLKENPLIFKSNNNSVAPPAESGLIVSYSK